MPERNERSRRKSYAPNRFCERPLFVEPQATDEQIAAYQQAYGGGTEAEEAENDESSSAARPKKRKASASNADVSYFPHME
jgi:hypothetical protein